MSDDLTAQLAASVRAAWEEQHARECGCAGIGKPTFCNYPKPGALVAWEQAQQVGEGWEKSLDAASAAHGAEETVSLDAVTATARASWERRQMKCNVCGVSKTEHGPACGTTWYADHCSPSQPSPALAYVLTRGSTPIRWYTSEARANQDLELAQGANSESAYYEVHAVPRVE